MHEALGFLGFPPRNRAFSSTTGRTFPESSGRRPAFVSPPTPHPPKERDTFLKLLIRLRERGSLSFFHNVDSPTQNQPPPPPSSHGRTNSIFQLRVLLRGGLKNDPRANGNPLRLSLQYRVPPTGCLLSYWSLSDLSLFLTSLFSSGFVFCRRQNSVREEAIFCKGSGL